MSSSSRAWLLVAAALIGTSGCAGNRTVPAAALGGMAPDAAGFMQPNKRKDTTSVLKSLVKQIQIGSTIDPKNGDRFPHGLSLARENNVLKQGQLLSCNFSDKTGAAGNGTTIEQFAPKAGSKPVQFAQNAAIRGCSALALTIGDSVWGAALAGRATSQFATDGKLGTTFKNAPFNAPMGLIYAQALGSYAQQLIVSANAQTGQIVRTDITNAPSYETKVVASGFAVNKAAGVKALGPTGLQYNPNVDTLYVVDGVNNTVVAISQFSNVLLTDAIVVQPGGKTFKGPEAKFARLVYSGTALKSPVASALLPNGNLIIANSIGNTLVEMTPTGQVLDQKVVDTKPTAGIFGLVASGTTDANTVLYYTDANSNTLQELTK
jgi:hypothetical protein